MFNLAVGINMNMKALTIILCVAFCSFTLIPTTTPTPAITYAKVDNKEMVKILNGFSVFSEMMTNKVSVRVLVVYETGTETASCDNTSMYLAVSEISDCPRQTLYKLNSVYGPKLIRWNKEDATHPSMVMEYGKYNQRKPVTVKIGIDGIKITETRS